MLNKVVIILVGNIGSGKSTLTSTLVEGDYVAIARDRLRYAIGGGEYIFNPKYEYSLHKTNMFLFAQFLKLGVNLVIDEVNANRAMRKEYIKQAHEAGYTVMAVELPRYSRELCVSRRMQQPHGKGNAEMWCMVWDSFDSRYKAPTKQEGFDHIISLTADVPKQHVWRIIGAELYGNDTAKT